MTNTDFVVVNGTPTSGADAFIVDQTNGAFAPGATPEPDGTSELETLIGTNDLPAALFVRGTTSADTMRIGAGGGVMLGPDLDTDVRLIRASRVTVSGGGGDDFLSKVVGTIDARPAAARLTSRGVVDLKATACKLSRHGKTVTAKLAFRLPESLAGEYLRVDVQATDKHGHRQLEPGAGVIRVR